MGDRCALSQCRENGFGGGSVNTMVHKPFGSDTAARLYAAGRSAYSIFVTAIARSLTSITTPVGRGLADDIRRMAGPLPELVDPRVTPRSSQRPTLQRAEPDLGTWRHAGWETYNHPVSFAADLPVDPEQPVDGDRSRRPHRRRAADLAQD